MRIVGIGIDIDSQAATAASMSRYGPSWLRRQFTSFEIDRAPAPTIQAIYFTSLFVVKEAVSKALGNGFDDDLPILSIQVSLIGTRVESIMFLPPAGELIAKLGVKQVKASVCLVGNHAVATAVAEG